MSVLSNIMKSATVLGIMVSGLSAGALAQPSTSVIEKGRLIAEKNCIRCHAIGRKGKSPHVDAPLFRDIVKRYSPWLLAEAFAEGIATGHPDMPTFKFQPEDINALLSYLESLEDKSNKTEPANQQIE